METPDKNEYFKRTRYAAGWLTAGLLILLLPACADVTTDSEKTEPIYEVIDGSLIYDYDPSTRVGDKIFGTIVADFESENPGRNSHGGPVALELANGNLVAFHSNATGHSVDGWSEYAISTDGGRTWDMYNKFIYSYNAYQNNPKVAAWVEEGLVTSKGTVVLFISHMGNPVRGGGGDGRTNLGFMRSYDNGATWSEYQPLDGSFAGYPAAVAVEGKTNYLLADSNEGPHVLYVSTDDGRSWRKRSTLPLEDSRWYGALCVMEDGRLLAGAYECVDGDEHHFFYCISEDEGHTWGDEERVYLDKRIRDPELAYLDGRYYLQGRAGHGGEYGRKFVLYQSDDGENWGEGTIISSLGRRSLDGYSHNVIINKYNEDVPDELMVLYSIAYDYDDHEGSYRSTNSYVFFIRPEN